MIPRWQWAAMLMMLIGTVALAVVFFPHSYAHAYLWGECDKPGEPKECHPRSTTVHGHPIGLSP